MIELVITLSYIHSIEVTARETFVSDFLEKSNVNVAVVDL